MTDHATTRWVPPENQGLSGSQLTRPSCLPLNPMECASGGKLIFHIFGALAEFERDLIKERTEAGLHAARERGRKGGRPKALTEKKLSMARALYADEHNTIAEICKTLNISKTSLYRYLKEK